LNSDEVFEAIYEYIYAHYQLYCGESPCDEGGKTIRITKLACMKLTHTIVWDTPTTYHSEFSLSKDVFDCGDHRYTCLYYVCWDEELQEVRHTFLGWSETGSGECDVIIPGSQGYELDHNWYACTYTWTGCHFEL
jgi:hypothetical protein